VTRDAAGSLLPGPRLDRWPSAAAHLAGVSILIALLAAIGAAVVTGIVAFFVLIFIFERTFHSDEGLGIVALAFGGALLAATVALAGTVVVLL
jgi:hypothetical protein